MFFLKGLGRYIALMIIVLIFYFLNGGDLHILWQPFPFACTLGIYAMFCYWALKASKNQPTLEKLITSGKSGLIASVVLQGLLSILHLLGHFSRPPELLIEFIAADLATIFHSTIIYFSFFSPIRFIDDDGLKKNHQEVRTEVLAKKGANS